MKTELVWITPDAEVLLGYIARVSNPQATKDMDSSRLINYLVENKHWSPFEMVSACFSIETSRAIARQILRHRSFSFQEFSQRYADATHMGFNIPELRMQHPTNRQSSLETTPEGLQRAWKDRAMKLITDANKLYVDMIDSGAAKECARAVLPEGCTGSKMYMSGTLRSWIHYTQLRCGNGTQKEHREIAQSISSQLCAVLPACESVFRQDQPPAL